MVAVAGLLVLAGCSGLSGDPSSQDGSGLSDAERPPGVEDGSLADAGELLDAHTASLNETGFESNMVVNGTVRQKYGGEVQNRNVSRRQQLLMEAGGTPYQYRTWNEGTGVRFDVWANETTQFTRVSQGGTAQYRTGRPAPPSSLTGEGLMAGVLQTNEYEVVGAERTDGTTLVTLRAEGPPSNATRAITRNVENVTSYRSTLVVDSQGRVHRLTVDATYVIGGEEATYHLGYELLKTGDIATQQPQWVDRIRERNG